MNWDFTTTWDSLALTPAVLIEYGYCVDPSCRANHYKLTLEFLFWTLEVWW